MFTTENNIHTILKNVHICQFFDRLVKMNDTENIYQTFTDKYYQMPFIVPQ